jgi:hypothetical protein
MTAMMTSSTIPMMVSTIQTEEEEVLEALTVHADGLQARQPPPYRVQGEQT